MDAFRFFFKLNAAHHRYGVIKARKEAIVAGRRHFPAYERSRVTQANHARKKKSEQTWGSAGRGKRIRTAGGLHGR